MTFGMPKIRGSLNIPNSVVHHYWSPRIEQYHLASKTRDVGGIFFPASFVAAASDSSKAFSAAYEDTAGKAPDPWGATGYPLMQTIANTIRNAGDDVNRETLREAMAATSGLPVVIGQGTLSFDENRIPPTGGIVMQLTRTLREFGRMLEPAAREAILFGNPRDRVVLIAINAAGKRDFKRWPNGEIAFHLGRAVSHGRTTAKSIRRVGARAVEQSLVMKRHLPSAQVDRDNFAGINPINVDFLLQNVVVSFGRVMRQDPGSVAATDDLHRTISVVCVIDGQPHRDRAFWV